MCGKWLSVRCAVYATGAVSLGDFAPERSQLMWLGWRTGPQLRPLRFLVPGLVMRAFSIEIVQNDKNFDRRKKESPAQNTGNKPRRAGTASGLLCKALLNFQNFLQSLGHISFFQDSIFFLF